MKIISTFLFLISPLSFANPICEVGNAIPESHKQIAKLIDMTWMKDAIYCDFGAYQILTPSSGKSNSIAILKNGKLFLNHENGFGINLFQSYAGKDPVPYITIQDWDKNGIYERLDYSLIDKNGNVVGNVQDEAMSGKVKIVKYQE